MFANKNDRFFLDKQLNLNDINKKEIVNINTFKLLYDKQTV